MKRWIVAMAVVALSSLSAVGPAAAAGEDYPPTNPPTVTAEALCINPAPYVSYSVTGTDAKTVTLTFVNPSGSDYVVKDLPLSGKVLWPGAVVKDGVLTDWPGWSKVDAVTVSSASKWVAGDDFDWTLPKVDVKFDVAPTATTTLTYPLPAASCPLPTNVKTDVETRVPTVLGLTGAQLTGAVGAVALMLGVGTALIVVRRRATH